MIKLSKIKRGILQSANRYPYVTDGTYTDEKHQLYNAGYLASYVQIINGESCIISGRYAITDKGRAALRPHPAHRKRG